MTRLKQSAGLSFRRRRNLNGAGSSSSGLPLRLLLFLFLIGASLQPSSAQAGKHDVRRHQSGAAKKATGDDTQPTRSENDKTAQFFVPPDSNVLNQDGKRVRFYTDLVKDKLIVINFVYTTCKSICPTQGASFAKLQSRLGSRLNTEVQLISISVDPEVDTPQRLKSWAASFGAKQGWTLITGNKMAMNDLVKALTGDPLSKGFHGAQILIANERKGKWVREYGLANVDQIIQRIDDVGK